MTKFYEITGKAGKDSSIRVVWAWRETRWIQWRDSPDADVMEIYDWRSQKWIPNDGRCRIESRDEAKKRAEFAKSYDNGVQYVVVNSRENEEELKTNKFYKITGTAKISVKVVWDWQAQKWIPKVQDDGRCRIKEQNDAWFQAGIAHNKVASGSIINIYNSEQEEKEDE